ncbi:hypothetical protein ACFSBX_01725 [Halobellus rarus]|uniref:Yip1 domain-containing protein n=1 Tax=Halobellus rarus TaxID=1126237 RepID=A0ABD6CJ28_9EURY
MATGRIGRAAVGLFDAVFRPSRFVMASNAASRTSVRRGLSQLRSLLVVFLTNVVLYATPLTLSGYGVAVETEAPSWFVPIAQRTLGNPDTAWWLFAGIAQNSVFLIALSAVTLLTYHAALVVTRSSKGFLLTVHTVVYSVSAYLAGIFTVLVFLSQAQAYGTARALVIDLQVRFISVFYDLFGVPESRRVFSVGEAVPMAQLNSGETAVLALLVALVLYFVYSMYLGARLNHGAGVGSAVLSLLAVGLSPAVYVAILLVYSTGGVTL